MNKLYFSGIYDTHVHENYSGMKLKKLKNNCTTYLSDFRNNKVNQQKTKNRLSDEVDNNLDGSEEKDRSSNKDDE